MTLPMPHFNGGFHTCLKTYWGREEYMKCRWGSSKWAV